MNLPVIVDISIGMIIIYISAALLLSGIQELIASVMQWRCRHLEESILQMIIGENPSDIEVKEAQEIRDRIYSNALVQSMNHTSVSGINLIRQLLDKVRFDKNIYQSSFSKTSPSYLDKETFAIAVINLKVLQGILRNCVNTQNPQEVSGIIHNIKEKIEEEEEKLKQKNELVEKIPESFKNILQTLAEQAVIKLDARENEILTFQKEIETWFDNSMARASGVYKRNTQLFLLALAFLVVIFLNLDSINIYKTLLNDVNTRNLLADNASIIVANSQIDSSNPNSQIDKQQLQQNITNLLGDTLLITPIYENGSNFMNCEAQESCTLSRLFSNFELFNLGKFFQASIGWMITTLAIYMGAPFWFELLSKLVNIRATGKKPN